MVARFKFRPEKNIRVEWLGLGEMVFRQEEADIAAFARSQAACTPARMEFEIRNCPLDFVACLVAYVGLVVKDQGDRGN